MDSLRRLLFADTTGNMWLVLDKPGLFIETSGANKDPEPPTRSLASLKGRAAGRVVRALCDYKPPYGIRELAQRTGIPLASVARVVGLLERDAVVTRSKNGGVAGADPVRSFAAGRRTILSSSRMWRRPFWSREIAMCSSRS